ncbi:putative transcriptional regulator [Algoriphagus alkaliphilus]|uniref:Putative transcriptional regulator n=2 Tax=Algoriphagus alkaliphilus TaxID=279824 RepID=A0A1G5W2S8_9BACT|nr:putative transcriptional regulator [Algoriphagus alkaliphilus]
MADLDGFSSNKSRLYCLFNADMKNSIKVERAKKDLTQQDLAEKVQVSRQTINSIEAGKYVPSTVLALKIARVFEIALEEIFELEEGDYG